MSQHTPGLWKIIHRVRLIIKASEMLALLQEWDSATNHALTRLSPSGRDVKERSRTLLREIEGARSS